METNKNPVLNAIKQREYSDQVAENLEKFGYAFIGVNELNEEDPKPAFVYTVGLHQRGFPDLFISGNLPQETAMRLINHVIDFWEAKGVKLGRINNFLLMADKKTKLPIGLKEVDLRNQAPIAPLDDEPTYASPLTTHLTELLVRFPNVKHRVVQLMWADTKGYLPLNDGYTDDPAEQQELLEWLE